jgi:hypothetical protein
MGGPAVSIAERLDQVHQTQLWVHASLDGLTLPELPHSKRLQLAGGSWHLALEHSQAIALLVDARLNGSALALMRPMFEVYARGLWLAYAATDAQVDDAGRDRFPADLSQLIKDLEGAHTEMGEALAAVKSNAWRHLCSLTHGGYQQVGSRLTSTGLAANYKDTEILAALDWAETIAQLVVVALSGAANRPELAAAADARIAASANSERDGGKTTR